MLERAREVTRNGKYTNVEYARFADDLVVLIHAYKRHDWLIGAVNKRLREEFAKLQVEINDEKSLAPTPIAAARSPPTGYLREGSMAGNKHWVGTWAAAPAPAEG